MYTITLSILILASLSELIKVKKDQLNITYFLCFLLFIFHDGLRWETGTDWITYYQYFENCLEPIRRSEFLDFGYTFLNLIVRIFTDNYSIFLILHAIILYSLIIYSIKKYSINPLLSLFLYYCAMLPFLGMNRQIIALGICMISLKYIIDKKPYHFITYIILAMLFHKSAIIFSVAYFFNRHLTNKTYLIVILISFTFSLTGLINRLPLNLFLLLDSESADKMTFYTDAFQSGDIKTSPILSFLGVLKRLIWVLPIIFFPLFLKNKNDYFSLIYNLYFLGTIFYIVFNNTVLQIFVSRGLIYFNIMEIFIVPYILTMFKNNFGKYFLFAVICFYAYLNMEKGVNYYKTSGEDIFKPYKGVFINTDYKRKL